MDKGTEGRKRGNFFSLEEGEEGKGKAIIIGTKNNGERRE
jgi:hypothetical protein